MFCSMSYMWTVDVDLFLCRKGWKFDEHSPAVCNTESEMGAPDCTMGSTFGGRLCTSAETCC